MPQSVKSLILPFAMLLGGVFYDFFAPIAVAMPYFIFAMLFLTFCKLPPSQVRLSRLHLLLLAIQVGGGLALYYLLAFFDQITAEGVFMCVFAPAAMASAVITGMLGGNVGFMTSYTLLSNVSMALIAPAVFAFMGKQSGLPFLESFLYIGRQLIPMLILPLGAAWALRWLTPALNRKIGSLSFLTFYIWAAALVSISGRTVKFLAEQQNPNYLTETTIAVLSLAICLLQFKGGKALGSRMGERTAVGQAMGQKNTILAIWMSQAYLNPVSSVGPASYVLWQNIVNSWQLWVHNRRENKERKKNLAQTENIA